MQVDLVVRHHLHELTNLPAGDKARAQHVVHAEGLGGRGGRRGGVVRRIGELLPQLQVVQDQAVAVVGNTQTVCGLAVGSGGKVGADPGRQPRARVRLRRRALHGPQGPGYPEAHALPPDRPGRQRRPASRVVFVVRVIS